MKYRRKPTVIEPFQVTEEIYDKLIDYVYLNDSQGQHPILYGMPWVKEIWEKRILYIVANGMTGKHEIFLKTLNGQCEIHPGDWILKGEKENDFYTCKPDVFEKIYEPV